MFYADATDSTTKQIATSFKQRPHHPEKLDAIIENRDRLEWFGLVIPAHRDGPTYWHFADTATAA